MTTRYPVCSGTFYPDEKKVLYKTVDEYMQLQTNVNMNDRGSRLIIAPHAGYMYSGSVAAYAFSLLKPIITHIETVAIIGPAHRVPFTGMALSSANAFSTPLGTLSLDSTTGKKLLKMDSVITNNKAHENEHCIEVELPFLQYLKSSLRILPIVTGWCSSSSIAKAIALILSEPQNAIVISSDLSHFFTYEKAKAIDSKTSSMIESLSPELIPEQACGCIPINGAITFAKQENWQAKLKKYLNSGDTSGQIERVVGYGAYEFFPA